MSDTIICSDWSTDRLASVVSSNKAMLESRDGCDVTFLVRKPDVKTETVIAAHRYVLCSRSPVFHRLLWSDKGSKLKKVPVTDVSAEALQQLIRFLYCEEANLTIQNVMEVLHASNVYEIPSLMAKCHQFVINCLTPSTACAMLQQCVDANQLVLADSCVRYISSQPEAIIKSNSFIESSLPVVSRIVSCDELSVAEVELFEACIAWARFRCRPGSKDDPSELRKHLEPIIPLIRFPTMSAEEFAQRVVPMNILTDTETCNIYKYFTCPSKPPKRFLSTPRGRPNNGEGRKLARKPEPTPRPQMRVKAKEGVSQSGHYPDISKLQSATGLASSPLSPSAPSERSYYRNHTFDLPPQYEIKG